jgi:hypothetical protein
MRNVELEEQALAATLAPLERLVEFLFDLREYPDPTNPLFA